MDRPSGFDVIIAASALIVTTSAAKQDRFPDAPGKAELLKVCSGCHQPENVFAYSKTVAEWSETLSNMAQLGAEGSPEEWQLLERYLDAQLALIKINSAPAGELQRTFDVPSAIAEAIVKYRQENGHFDAIEDVKKVPGLDAAKVDARKDRLFF